MPRIAGVDIPSNKRLWVSLTYIYGIGPKFSRDICQRAGVDSTVRTSKLTDEEIGRIAAIIDADYVVEGNLKRKVAASIDRLKMIKCYRGDRHKKNLPTRGQRTRSNARTRKGPKKTVAGKKGVKEMR